MNSRLLRVVRTVIRADSDPARQILFANLMEAQPVVRLVYGVHLRLRGTWAGAVLVSCYGLAALLTIAPARNRRARVIVLAKHQNARRQVARIVSWLGAAECGWVRTGPGTLINGSILAGVALCLSRRRLSRTVRVMGGIDRRHGFLVSCRAAGAIAWYGRAMAMLSADRPGAVLVSSDSNPEEVGFDGAARALGIPRVFVSHAYPTPLSPPLDFSLSILEGEAAVNARRRKGPIRGEVILAGIEGESGALDASRFSRARPTIGIFTPKAIAWPALIAAIDDCRQHFGASRIIMRWHPSMLQAPHLASHVDDCTGVVESPRTATLEEVTRQCDWVVADENSNVHLQVLKLGTPTVAVSGLGLYPKSHADQYGFAANGIVYPPVRSIRDVQSAALAEFFSGSWATRFRQYDASYLRPPEEVAAEVRDAILRLVEDAVSREHFR
ncbi:MAG: hypothetical protein O2930_14350 [Acidobacteria bacterium]|nr:hypothetical protein [Acidobacteriota bacterium]